MVKHFYESDSFCFRHHTSYNYPIDAHTAHSHNVYELIYFISGDATHIIENRRYKLKKGDLILIPPLKHHFIKIDSVCDYERFDILFDPDAHGIESVHLLDGKFDVINLNNHSMANDIIRKTDYYFKRFQGEEFVKVTSLLLSELFYLLSVSTSNADEDVAESSPILSRALEYINENLTALSDIGEVARNCFVTESYLFRIFKNELHHSPKRYINEKRLLLADRKISNGEKPTVVYEKCGFSDYTTFYRNYISFFGHAPSDRNHHQIVE